MEQKREEVPLPEGTFTVGIIYNLKKNNNSQIEDIDAEYDGIETVNVIKEVFEKNSLQVKLFEADENLSESLKRDPIDFAFNIAEGKNGRGREAQVPALLTMLGIPFSGSDETTLCIALDKALAKRLLTTYKVKSPKSAVISENGKISVRGLKYPLIIKPNAEGSSKGISDVSIVNSTAEFKELVKLKIDTYKEDMLAEEYIEGREFTVGIVGNGKETHVFLPMEIKFRKPTQGKFSVYSFNVKKNYKEYVDYACPSDIDQTIQNDMMKISEKIYKSLNCRDFSRIDYRVDKNGEIYFIEINPLPGLAPGYSDFPMLAQFNGIDYDTLIMNVLLSGVNRCGLNINIRGGE